MTDLQPLLRTLAEAAGLTNRVAVTSRQQNQDAARLLNLIERMLVELEAGERARAADDEKGGA
jgi:hypothetical protein